MKKAIWLIVVTLVAFGSAASFAAGPAAKDEKPAALQNLALATQLRQYGEAQNDPLALLLAARLVGAVPMAKSEGIAKKPATVKAGQEAATKPGKPSGLDVGVLLADAKRFAAGDPDVLALVTREAAAGKTRSAAGKALIIPRADYHTDRVLAGTVDTYDMSFPAGHCAVVLAGDGDTNLQLLVVDRQGNLVCSRTAQGDDKACEWDTDAASVCTVEVKNLGAVYNEYLIAFFPQ